MLENVFSTLPPTRAVDVDAKFVALDLSVGNPDLGQPESGEEFEQFIEKYLDEHNAAAAYGGYNEQRNLYKRSELFQGDDERDIHIGLDIWAKSGTPVLAVLDGEVHGFDYNAGIGNYGPTIILKHKLGKATFYTLYGHLSVESIEDIEIGDKFARGAKIATLGDSSVNGDYAPHLHFQIIKDIEGNFGDYPGVCSKNDLDFYLENCPDPNLLLKLK